MKTQRKRAAKRVEQSIPHLSEIHRLDGSVTAAEVGFCLTSLSTTEPYAIRAAISIFFMGRTGREGK